MSLACELGHVEVVEFLLKLEADVNAQDAGPLKLTPINYVADHVDPKELLDLLMNHPKLDWNAWFAIFHLLFIFHD